MARKLSGRIIYPANVYKILTLAESVAAKHQTDGADSPLHALSEEKWEDIAPNIDQAHQLHLEAEALHMQAEAKKAERDIKLKAIVRITRASGSYLKALNRGNPKALGSWGYTVDDSPQKKQKKTAE